MKKILLFYSEDCPCCHYARRALEELAQENAAYATIDVQWIEENQHSELSSQFFYYYVPTIYYGEEKLYEAHPSEGYSDVKEHIRAALDKVIKIQ